MKKLSILLFVMVSLSSYVISQEKETGKEGGTYAFQPKPLIDDWWKWFVGEWEGLAESHAGTAKLTLKIDFGLNGQFLIIEGKSEITELDDEQKQYLKDSLGASDEDIETYRNSPFTNMQIHTIDPITGEVVGYLFDSMRCIAEGRGKREGQKEIMEWKWSGNAQGATSVAIIERINDDQYTIYNKYILPNGNKMEDKVEMTRTRTTENGS